MELPPEIHHWLGIGSTPQELSFLQVSLRGVIVFVATLVMVRIGDKRFLPKKTAFDAILVFILASMLARAVNGSAAFFPTLGCGFVLVILHRFFAAIAFRSHAFGKLIKGSEQLIIRDGVIDDNVARQNDLTIHDIKEELRLNGKVGDPGKVKEAWLERSGEISVIQR
jgi:uncharacterized membrane protein YcaP (DUF421 family)